MNDQPQHKRLVPLKYFVVEMLGFKNVVSYYNHMHEPGFPQRVYPTAAKKPMLIYEECLAYQDKVTHRAPVVVDKPPAPSRKRHTGRPAKVARRTSG
jgi:hypothetical protein